MAGARSCRSCAVSAVRLDPLGDIIVEDGAFRLKFYVMPEACVGFPRLIRAGQGVIHPPRGRWNDCQVLLTLYHEGRGASLPRTFDDPQPHTRDLIQERGALSAHPVRV